MKDLILVGGGGHCKACIDVIENEGEFQIIGILDSANKVGDSLLDYDYVGTDEEIKHYVELGAYFLITVGHVESSTVRKKIAKELEVRGARLATVISSRAYVAKTATVDAGTVVMHDALVNAGARIGSHCIINSKALIEHDSVVEALCHISTGAVVNGDAKVGSGTFVGSNAVVKQGVTLASDSFFKAGRCHSGRDKKEKVAFLTTLFPVPEQYVRDFMQSLCDQTYKKFDLILMNDEYGNTDFLREEFSDIKIIEISSQGSIPKNREELIRFALANGYDIAIFGDIDDYFSENRIQQSIEQLSLADIVVNEISPFSERIKPAGGIISKRIAGFSNISLDFVLNKNIFGLSNTAINLNKVNEEILCFPEDLIAVDWYFFSSLLLTGLNAVFLSENVTYYRQHIDNTAGISEISADFVIKAIKVRLGHYFHMSNKDKRYKSLYEKELILSRLFEDKDELNKVVCKNQKEVNSPLWWEIIV